MVTVTKPTLIVLLVPSISTEDVPMVRIPVILVSPSTRSAVVADPVFTFNPLLKVLNPNASWLTTSSYRAVPATVILPSKYATSSVVLPAPTYKLYPDLAVVPIPTFLRV